SLCGPHPISCLTVSAAPAPLLFFLQCCADPPTLHSFPTRRSSDLRAALVVADVHGGGPDGAAVDDGAGAGPGGVQGLEDPERPRSEEHTSELQSQSNLVCRLLLEKKKLIVCFAGCGRFGLVGVGPQ